VAIASLHLAACSSTPPENADPTTATQSQPLCDGSDAVRLQYTSGGGFFPGSYYGFLAPFLSRYLFVDGHCRYWVSAAAWAGVRIGSLTDDQANTLETELHYAEFAELNGDWETRGCNDGGTWTVSDGASQIGCYCGCTDDDVPAAVSEVG
jgi:hypothetical protein